MAISFVAMNDPPHLRYKMNGIELLSLGRAEYLQHLAAHEAGHAVVGLARGFALLAIDIQMEPTEHPDGGFVMGGVVFDAPDGDMNALLKEQPAEAAVVLMAGSCAEQVLLGSHMREGWSGDLRILRIGHGWLGGMPELPPVLIKYMNRAYEDVLLHQTEIRDVANTLLLNGRLTANDVQAVLARD
jgi:hypothetical protein